MGGVARQCAPSRTTVRVRLLLDSDQSTIQGSSDGPLAWSFEMPSPTTLGTFDEMIMAITGWVDMSKSKLALASGIALLLAACSSSDGSKKIPAPDSSAPTTLTAKAPISPKASATPLSGYAAQFKKIYAAPDKLQDQLRSLPDDTSNEQASALAARVAKSVQEADSKLLRANWPPQIATDIRALVVADGPPIGDLADLQNGADRLVADSGPANAALNIVLADLHLPAKK